MSKKQTIEGTEIDEVGYWSELKLDILRDYATEYCKILAAQGNLEYSYIDAFAGAGVHLSKETGELIPGSPLNALNLPQPFNHYYLIDLDQKRTQLLQTLTKDRRNVTILSGDCNEVLPHQVFPKIRYDKFQRALCILDPYGINLNWEIIASAGKSKTIDIFVNFPIGGINRNVLRKDRSKVHPNMIDRMNKVWGDETWNAAAFSGEGDLFGYEEKQRNEIIAEAFRKRIAAVAGFKHVPPPIPMRNKSNAIIYYLYFASQKPVAERIVSYIFDKYHEHKG
jgi:three-Cys-motif partner protein